MSVVEIAKLMGISRSRVWQIEMTALAKMARHPVMKELIEDLGLNGDHDE